MSEEAPVISVVLPVIKKLANLNQIYRGFICPCCGKETDSVILFASHFDGAHPGLTEALDALPAKDSKTLLAFDYSKFR